MRGKKTDFYKIGVFLSTCNGDLSEQIDFDSLKEQVGGISMVEHVVVRDSYTSPEGRAFLAQEIKENNLDRIVIAAGSPRTLENVLISGARDAGLDPFKVEMVNIREQCCYPHLSAEDVTSKAYVLVACGVARVKFVAHQEASLENIPLDNKDVLVIGGGIAGVTAAKELADKGVKVHLVEKTGALGGLAAGLDWERVKGEYYIDKADIDAMAENDNITLHLGTTIKFISGVIGNYYVKIETQGEEDEKADHADSCGENDGCACSCGVEDKTGFFVGAVVIATGSKLADMAQIVPYSSEDPDVIDFLELEKMTATGELKKEGASEPVADVHFIQCAGSRDSYTNHHCSLVCCTYAISQAMRIKKISPETAVYVHYMDLRGPYNNFEEAYIEAQEAGVQFIRGRVAEVSRDKEGLKLIKETTELGDPSEWNADLVVLSAGQVPSDGTAELAEALELVIDVDGFPGYYNKRYTLKERKGICIVGTAQGPRNIKHSIRDAKNAAREILDAVNNGIEVYNVRSTIDKQRCVGCGVCEVMCPYQAITMIDDVNNITGELRQVSDVNLGACQGCGACAMACPSSVPTLLGYSNQEVFAQIDELL